MERKVLHTVKIEVEFEVIESTNSFPCNDCCFQPHINCLYKKYCKGGYLRVKDNK